MHKWCMEVLHITCNICTRDLPDMYALSSRALGIRNRQILHAHVTITYPTFVKKYPFNH